MGSHQSESERLDRARYEEQVRRALRARKGELDWTIDDIHEKSGLAIATINRALNGPGFPREQTLRVIATTLGLGPDGLPKPIDDSGAIHLKLDVDFSGYTDSEKAEIVLRVNSAIQAAANDIAARRQFFRHHRSAA